MGDPIHGTTRSEQPGDRRTRLADAAGEAFYAHPEHRDGDRAIVYVMDADGGGIWIFGYDDNEHIDVSAMVDLFMLLKAIANANGRDVEFIGIPDSPEGL